VSGGIAQLFLTSALEGAVWSASRPGRVTRYTSLKTKEAI